MFSIGEFSKITGLTVKTLRFYHEQKILLPSRVEAGSGYRFYDESKIDSARIITSLRDLEFSIADIKEILSNHDDDADIIEHLRAQQAGIRKRMRSDRQIVAKLDHMISTQKQANDTMNNSQFTVEEKTVEPLLVASIRMKGNYEECGSAFSKIGKAFGRYLSGKPMMLYHDGEYRSDDANFEPAMPIKPSIPNRGKTPNENGRSRDEIAVHQLPGGRCLSLMHLGPYDELGRSYEKIMKHAKTIGVEYSIPTREIFHKGPGMIFKGNPNKYLTEIQLMFSES